MARSRRSRTPDEAEAAPAAAATTGAASGSGWGAGEGGAEATIAREREAAERRREQGFMPLRFWQKQGEDVEVVILDHSLTDPAKGCGFILLEHNLPDSNGKWGNFESCPSDFANCAVCETFPDHKPYRILLLTVGVLKEWTSKKDQKTHQYSKMLLPIKMGQVEHFQRLQEIANKQGHDSIRGMCFLLKRGTGAQSYSIGEPVANDDGQAFEMWSEDDLLDEFGHDEIKDRKGKVLKPANEDTRPFIYAELFPRPDADDIRQRYGGGATPGSRREAGGSSTATETSRPARGRRRAAAEETTEAVEAEVVDDGPTRGRGRRSRAAAAPAAAGPADPFDTD